jgi:SHS2 domain-containing protein
MPTRKKFTLIDISTADMAFVASGATLEELFENAAAAMFYVMTGSEVKPEKEKKVEVAAPDIEGLMVDWLNELLFVFDTEKMLFSKFQVKIKKNGGCELSGTASGEVVTPEHKLKAYVKAATYHMLEVKKEKKRWKVQVVLDV